MDIGLHASALWQTVFSTIGSAGLLAVAAFLGRTWIEARLKERIALEYARTLEDHKAQLRREVESQLDEQRARASRELEQLRSSLAVASAAHGVAFNSVYSRRVEAVAAIHGRLVEVNTRLGAYLTGVALKGGPSKDDLYQKLFTALEEFDSHYPKHTIFLPTQLSERLAAIRMDHVAITNQFRLQVHPRSEDGDEEMTERWATLLREFDGAVRKSMKELESEMRTLLADTNVLQVSTHSHGLPP